MDAFPIEQYLTAGRRQHTDAGFAAGGFAAAAFAHNAKGFALLDGKGHVVHRFEQAFSFYRVIFAQIFHFQHRGLIRHGQRLLS